MSYRSSVNKSYENKESPKGYYYVNRVEPTNGTKEILNHSEKYANPNLISGVLIGKMQALKPLCFTQSLLAIVNSKPTYLLHREAGKIVLSGSQLKGAIKTYMQAFSMSYDDEERIDKNKLDLVNSITGYMGYTSRIMFKDIIIDEKDVETEIIVGKLQWSQADKLTRENKIRLYSHKKHEELDRKVNFEVLPPGSAFTFEILLNGLKNEEAGLLFLAMGFSPKDRFALKIGRGKNLDMGSVKFIPERLLTPKHSFDVSPNIIKDKDLVKLIFKSVNKYKSQMHKKNLENLQKIIKDSEGVFQI
jgi:CRISPR/Cas system CSM-associated protein Csm3 (group 7 of RAMP superfamily)